MRHLLKIASLGLLAIFVVTTALAWLVLEARPFNPWRAKLLSDVLTIETGRQVEVEGEVKVTLGLPIAISVSDVRIPSEQILDEDLATLGQLTLSTDPLELIRGKLEFDRLSLSGAKLYLRRTDDDLTTWSRRNQTILPASAVEDKDVASSRFKLNHHSGLPYYNGYPCMSRISALPCWNEWC